MCLLPVTLVWAPSRACVNPLIVVCGGQQSSVSLHFPCQAWHSRLQLAMCRWQHLPTVLPSSKTSGDDQFSVLQKTVFQKRKLAIWANKGQCWMLVGPDERHCPWTLPLDHHTGNGDFPRNSIPICWGPIWISLFFTVKNLYECPPNCFCLFEICLFLLNGCFLIIQI